MPRLEVPLIGRTLWQTGDILLRAELDLLLKDNHGIWKTETFRVDSGAEITMMAAALARSLDLPMPVKATTALTVATPSGQAVTEIRSGILQAQVLGMDGTEYFFPCFFLGDPTGSFVPGQAILPRNLLGLSGVVDKLKIEFDPKPRVQAPYGMVVVEKR